MGWETLANIGPGATHPHSPLWVLQPLSRFLVSRSFCSFYFIFVVLSMLAYISFSPFLFFSFFSFSSYVEFFSYSLPLLFRPSLDRFIQSHSFFHLSLLYSRLVSPFLHPRFFFRRIFLPCTSLSLPVFSFLFFYAFLQRLFLLPLWESLCLNWISLFFIQSSFYLKRINIRLLANV